MSTVGSYRGPNIVTRGLVLHLDAASPNSYYSPNGGTVWKDVSGNGNDGTLVNSPSYSEHTSKRFQFDGTNTKVSINSDAGVLLENEMSADIWFNLASYSTVLAGDIFYNDGGYVLFVGSSTQVATSFHSTAAADIPQTTGGSISLNTWTNLAMVRDGITVEWYQNGVSIGTDTDPGGYMLITTVGGFRIRTQYRTDGDIASFRVYNRALTAQEVLQNFNSTKDRFGL